MNINLNLHQLYITTTSKVAIPYVSYIHVAAIVCRDPPLCIKGKALAYIIKAEEKVK